MVKPSCRSWGVNVKKIILSRLHNHHRQPGQAIVIVALVLVVLVAFVGLGVDGANAFAQRRNANVAADAAAMAGARALLDGNMNSSHNHNRDVYDAINTYITTHLPGGGGTSTVTWQAYYIGQNGLKVGGAIPRDGSSLSAVDVFDTSPSSIRGISVDLHYTFNTYFMLLMGRDTLNVQAYGLAYVGPLGGASGLDIVPLAIRLPPASQWSRSAAGTQWNIDMFNSTPSLSVNPGLVGTVDLRQVTLLPDGPAPTLGSANSCDSYSASSPEENLSYWWCKGTANRLVSNTDQQTIGMPVSSALRAAIQWRIDHPERATVLFPVYENKDNPMAPLKNIRGFIAIKLLSISGTVVRGQYVKYYSAPGPLNGNTSGFFGSYAINLVQ